MIMSTSTSITPVRSRRRAPGPDLCAPTVEPAFAIFLIPLSWSARPGNRTSEVFASASGTIVRPPGSESVTPSFRRPRAIHPDTHSCNRRLHRRATLDWFALAGHYRWPCSGADDVSWPLRSSLQSGNRLRAWRDPLSGHPIAFVSGRAFRGNSVTSGGGRRSARSVPVALLCHRRVGAVLERNNPHPRSRHGGGVEHSLSI